MTTGDSVVVGVDGSDAAVETARWAVCEAVARDLPLKLIFAADTIRTQGHSALSGPEVTRGEDCLRTAAAAIDAMNQRVKVEAEVVWGPPSNALVQQSRSAALVCVGSTGIGAVARAALGSTATAVAGLARCSVAVIRPRDRGDAADFVAVGVDDQPEVDGLLEPALEEARLRRSALVVAALGCNVFGVNSLERTAIRVDTWKRRYPDVAVYVMAAQSSLSDFLADHHDDLRERYGSGDDTDAWARPLAVLDAADVHDVARIVGPHDHSILRHAYCSVLVAR